ncbi:hypothetical protein [Pseudomonas sp. B1(2018)]|uniref:hypothetical protein n=1 Tax=Pseudomonas sp. B1(2018) TaxID=2233856 RepID=UPI001058104D|nr:hypothetical protein [Pseudomonas sp. B1(2018)]
MSERNARDVLKGLSLDGQTAPLDEIRTAYIRDLRGKAAGRGGSQLEQLNRARIDDLQQKAANGRLAYHEKLRSLISAGEAERVLSDWASFANREYLGGLERILQEIENVQKLTIDRTVVAKVAGPTTERIAGYARKLGAELVGSSGEIQPAA